MKSKIILMTKKKIVLYLVAMIIILAAVFVIFKMKSAETFSSAEATQLELHDGTYAGIEKTDTGIIKVELTVKKGKIDSVKLADFPASEIEKDKALKAEVDTLLKEIEKNASTGVEIDANKTNAYVLTKVLKAVQSAEQQAALAS